MSTRQVGGLLPYPDPGKFEGELRVAQLLYGMDTDGETGSVDGPGWFGLLYSPLFSSPAEARAAGTEAEMRLTKDEVRLLTTKTGGVIVHEDSQGFFSVEWFASKKDLHNAWADIESDTEEFEEETE